LAADRTPGAARIKCRRQSADLMESGCRIEGEPGRTNVMSYRSTISSGYRVARLVLLVLLAAAAGPSRAVAPSAAVQEASIGTSAEAALARLKEGNRRFRTGAALHPNVDAARLVETAGRGQAPFAAILGCSDSRVPCELVFDQGVGDLFVVRVAGNVCAVDEVASIEYGVGHLGAPLIVVLGHEKCGAVTAVVNEAELEGSIPQLVDHIRPAVAEAQRLHPGLKSDALVRFALRANVVQSIEDLFRRSGMARTLVREGKLTVVGAIYDLETGEVTWTGPHPRQGALVRDLGTEEAPGQGGANTPAHATVVH
jgi:carbonic anhydrase